DFRASGAAEAPARAGVPAPGVYRFRQRGEERAGTGPLTISRDYPAQAVYIVRPVAGGYHEDLRMSAEHVEEVRFRVDRTGSRAVWRRTMVTFAGMGTDDRDDVTPPSLDHPADLAVGRTWGGRYAQGDLDVTYRAAVTGRGAVELDGRRVP